MSSNFGAIVIVHVRQFRLLQNGLRELNGLSWAIISVHLVNRSICCTSDRNQQFWPKGPNGYQACGDSGEVIRQIKNKMLHEAQIVRVLNTIDISTVVLQGDDSGQFRKIWVRETHTNMCSGTRIYCWKLREYVFPRYINSSSIC